MSVVNDLGYRLASVPTGVNYTIECENVAENSPLMDLLSNCFTAASARLNPDETLTFEEASLIPAHQNTKEKENMERVTIPMPVKMLRNGRATVVFFADDTKIVVKLPEGTEDCEYNAFCAAIAKKMFGTNARIKSKIEKIREVVPTEEEKKAALEQDRAEAQQKRQAEIERKVERRAHEIVLEKMAKTRAKEMMGEC